MSKTKRQRGLCEFHGCQQPGIVLNDQSMCQMHRDQARQAEEEHQRVMREIRDQARAYRAKMAMKGEKQG